MDFWRAGFEGIGVTAVVYAVGWLVAFGLGAQAAISLRREPFSRWVYGLLIAGFLLRLGWIFWTQPHPISDYEGYWWQAGVFAAGDLRFDNIDKHPGIMLLLTVCRFIFGASYWPVWVLNLLLSGWVMILIYRLGKRLFNEKTALIALALAAFQPQLIAYSALFASELPTLFLYLLLVWLILESRQFAQPQWRHWAAMGAILYTAVLTRSTALVFAPLAVAILLLFRRYDWKAQWRGLTVFAVTAGLMLSTWLYHQYLLTGKAQLFWGGEIWLVATTHYETQSRLVSPPTVPGLREQIEAATKGKAGPQARLAELAADKAWALQIIRRDPVRYFREGGLRLRHILWTTSETGIRDSQWGADRLKMVPDKTFTRLAEISKHLWRITFLLSCMGFLLTWFRWRQLTVSAREGLVVISGFLAVWLGFHYLMAVASDRWAVQIIPFVLLFAAQGLGIPGQWVAARLSRKG